MSYKISDVTKALKNAGFVKLDGEDAIFGNNPKPSKCYYKYKGALYANGVNVGFCINNKSDAKIFGAFATSAIDEGGTVHETWTAWSQLFFPRLFGFINGTMTEAEIIKEVCG